MVGASSSVLFTLSSCVAQSKWWRRWTWDRRRSMPGWSSDRTNRFSHWGESGLCRWRLRSWCTGLERRKHGHQSEQSNRLLNILWRYKSVDDKHTKRKKILDNTKKKIKSVTQKILTGDELKDARDGEPLSFVEGEELSHKHKDAQDGEYTSEDWAGLHCLEVVCRGSQRESSTMKQAVHECVCVSDKGVS